MRRRLILPLLAAALTGPASRGVAAAVPSPNAAGCYDPADFGAQPVPGVDSRPGAQAAIDAAVAAGGGRVCFGAGRWRLNRAPLGSYNRFAALSTHGAHLEITGAGPGTVLEIAGDQGAGTLWVLALDPGAHDVTIRDLTIDTSAATNTDEQTHAIEVGSGLGTGFVEDVRIERVRFLHPATADGSRKGDCLRLVGATPESAVRRVTVIGSTFTSCARSGIAIQRNVFDLVIEGNQFTEAGDQDIDSEPTGSGQNGSVAVIGNVFHDDVAVAQGDFAVTLGGIGDPMARVTLANNVFDGRGVGFYRIADATVTGNTFDATMEQGRGVINIENVAARMVVQGNTVRRRGATGAPIRVQHHSGGAASQLVIANNVLTNETPGNGIDMESVQDVSVSGNDIAWTVPAPQAVGVRLRSVIVPADGVMISGNRIAGSLLAGVFLGASPQPFKAVSIVGNMAHGAALGLRCDQSVAGNYTQPIVHAANYWQAPSQCLAATLVPALP
jgi:hypothetical protein